MDQTQVMVGNFPCDVRAQDLAAYLQRLLGIVDRCKVKRISGNTPPHAFVQFVSAAVVREACLESDHGSLFFKGGVLKIIPCTSTGGAKPSPRGNNNSDIDVLLSGNCCSICQCSMLMSSWCETYSLLTVDIS